jgi:hypothetical protein
LAVLGPLGAEEAFRYPTYRGSEEVVYLRVGAQYLGLRPADGGEHHYYDVGIEHLAVFVDSRHEVDDTHQRCVRLGANIPFRRRRTATNRAIGRCSSSTLTASASRWPTGRESVDSNRRWRLAAGVTLL